MIHQETPIARRLLAIWRPAVLLCIAFTHAAPAIDLTARVDRAEVTVGEPIRYEITVIYPAGARVDLPAVRGNTGALEVTGYAVRADTAPDGRAEVTHTLTLAAWAVGGDTLPPQRVEIRFGADTAATVLYTQPTYITVKPTAPPDAKDIADIYDGERLPGTFPWWIAILIAAALALWAWLRRRARRPKPALIAAPRAVSADEAALARLLALENEGLIAQGRAREFAFALSEILREYLANRFGIDALEATTAELLERAAPLPLTEAQRAWLGGVCGELDTVKFATGALAAEDADRLLRETRDFVRATFTSFASSPPTAAIAPAAGPGTEPNGAETRS